MLRRKVKQRSRYEVWRESGTCRWVNKNVLRTKTLSSLKGVREQAMWVLGKDYSRQKQPCRGLKVETCLGECRDCPGYSREEGGRHGEVGWEKEGAGRSLGQEP